MIGDGIVPQNEGRGYVLRRLLRRAARHGRLLGVREPFLYKVCHTVIDENKSAYPNLDENRDYIVKVIRTEEERFAKTIDRGMELLAELIAQIKALPAEQQALSGEQAFRLYDTFGFPLDLTREILDEQTIGLDEEAFGELMKQQRERARAARAGMGDLGWEDDALSALEGTTQFVGYGQLSYEAAVRAIVRGGELAGALSLGDAASVVLDITPFYAESGGQAGDIGEITTENGVFEVTGCIKSPTGHFLHNGRMKRGTLLADSRVTAAVSAQHRLDVMRNHTAAHLLQWALREVLGTHVHQAGQLVNAEVCRFDFTHFAALTHEELVRVEQLVNAQILSAQPVTVESMSQAAAKEKGAMALFSEKYGDTVRVVDIGGKSIELCGGTHAENTSHLGLFKILKESSVAAGVRRIEAVTGWGAVRHINELEAQLTAVADVFKTGAGPDLAAKAAAVLGEIKERDRRIDELNSKLASAQLDELIAKAVSVDGVRLIRAWLTDVRPEEMRVLGDRIKERSEAVVAVGSAMEKKASILAVASKQAVERGAHAGKLVRELSAKLGGSGGGRPDSAMGGGSEPSRAQEALDAASALLGSMIKR
jgi:alanyl-tRNA synthetase